MPGVWTLIMASRISSLSSALLTMNKDMQGGLTSNIFIIVGILINLSCVFLAWETFITKMLGPVGSTLAHTIDVGNALPYTAAVDGLRALKETFSRPLSLKVSSFARVHSRAVAGFLYCIGRTSELLTTSDNQSGSVGVIPSHNDVTDHCSSSVSSVHWRSVAGSTLMISSLIPLVLLIALLLANIYLSKRRNIDAGWKGLTRINEHCSPVAIQQPKPQHSPELMSPELYHRNSLNMLPYPHGQMSLYNAPHHGGNPTFIHRNSPELMSPELYHRK